MALARRPGVGASMRTPVSQDSPIEANARLNPAVSATRPQVARERECTPRAGRDAVDGGDDRLGHRGQRRAIGA